MASDNIAKRVEEMKLIYSPVGIVHSEHTIQEDTPIQGVFNKSIGRVEIFQEFEEGLTDIESFSHLILLYHFDRATGCELKQKPFLDGQKDRGIFSIRHFNRPNPIGISIVDNLGREGRFLEIGAVDILDGTPILDIKPYVYRFDHRDEVKSGWVDDQHLDDIAEWNASPKGLRERERVNR